MATIQVTTSGLTLYSPLVILNGRGVRSVQPVPVLAVPQINELMEDRAEALTEWGKALTAALTRHFSDVGDGTTAGGGSLPILDSSGRIILDNDGHHVFDSDGIPWVDGPNVVVDTAKLADAAVTTQKMANLSVDNSKLAALSVDAAKLANSAVTTTKIANAAVGTAAIANAAVGTAQIANLAVTNALIGTAAITDAKVNSLSGNKIFAGTITATQLATNSVTTNKLAAVSVSSDKIQSFSISTDKIAAGAITAGSGKIANLAVETLQLGDRAVTIPENTFTLGSLAISTAWTSVQTGAVSVPTGIAFTPLLIFFTCRSGVVVSGNYGVRILKNGGVLVDYGESANFNDWPNFAYEDVVSPGFYVYTVQFRNTIGGQIQVAARNINILGVKR